MQRIIETQSIRYLILVVDDKKYLVDRISNKYSFLLFTAGFFLKRTAYLVEEETSLEDIVKERSGIEFSASAIRGIAFLGAFAYARSHMYFFIDLSNEAVFCLILALTLCVILSFILSLKKKALDFSKIVNTKTEKTFLVFHSLKKTENIKQLIACIIFQSFISALLYYLLVYMFKTPNVLLFILFFMLLYGFALMTLTLGTPKNDGFSIVEYKIQS